MFKNIQVHRGLVRISSCHSLNWDKVVKKVLFCSIFILFHQRSIALEEVGDVAATTTIDGLGTAFGICSCANAGIKLYSVGKDMKSYTFPNEKEQVENRKISKELALAMAKSDFKHCLITHKFTNNNGSSGIPTSCEEAALMLIRCGGEHEVTHLTTTFNKKMKGK